MAKSISDIQDEIRKTESAIRLLEIQQRDFKDLGISRDNTSTISQYKQYLSQLENDLTRAQVKTSKISVPLSNDVYDVLLRRLDAATTEEEFHELAEAFRNLPPGKYPNANRLAAKCDSLMVGARQKREEKEQKHIADTYTGALKKIKDLESQSVREVGGYYELAGRWEELAKTFRSIDYNDSSELASVCRERAADAVVRGRSKDTRKKIGNTIGTMLQLGIAAIYLYIFFFIDFPAPYNVQNRTDWNNWMPIDFLQASLPLAAYALAVSVMSLLFLRKSHRVFGSLLIIIVGLVHSITLSVWYADAGLGKTIGVALVLCICGTIVSVPGLLLSRLER